MLTKLARNNKVTPQPEVKNNRQSSTTVIYKKTLVNNPDSALIRMWSALSPTNKIIFCLLLLLGGAFLFSALSRFFKTAEHTPQENLTSFPNTLNVNSASENTVPLIAKQEDALQSIKELPLNSILNSLIHPKISKKDKTIIKAAFKQLKS